MTPLKYVLMLFLVLPGITTYSQDTKTPAADTAISFKVYGVCIQCKDRIENALKIKGVKKAVWDMDSKILALVYDPAQVTLNKIENKIVALGHDLENKKARKAVYNALPTCCLYRDMETALKEMDPVGNNTQLVEIKNTLDSSLKTVQGVLQASPFINGIVLEEDDKGKLNPLANATVSWLGTNEFILTDSTGVFSILHDKTKSMIVVSYAGYQSDTMPVSDMAEVKIVLASKKQLREVTVTAKQRSTYVNNLSVVRTQTMTGKELLKAACCNLSESFETNPSVDVTYSDAVTGSKQIQLLGLSGNYTQLTVENLPGPRGIATPLGLNSIAGPWIESIQLTKGVGSVANGYESIAGQINVELKKPENSEKLLANLYVNDFGKTDLNLNLSKKLNKNWSAGLLLHDDFFYNKKLDFNKDGFRDLPTGNTFSMVNRYAYDNSKGTLVQFGIKVLNDRRTGGEVGFNPETDKYSTHHYGLGINTDRYEAFAKIGYVFPQQKYKSIGLQVAAISHRQESYFGLTSYNAKQQTIYGNFIYQSIINTTAHKFRTGFSFLYDKYNENFNTGNYKRNELVPGIFGEYTFTPNDKFSTVIGLRGDHNSLFGFFITPRLNIRYEPFKGTVIRASAGRGQRTANIFAENTSVFASARQVNIMATGTGKAYGLNPEVAWNRGVSIDQKFRLFDHDALFTVDFFRNDFTNQVVVDMENPRQVKFYNLEGRSFSNSFQAEVSVEPLDKFEIRLAYRYFDVQTTYSGQLTERALIAKNRAFANLAYALHGFKFDYTVTYNGKKRIPYTGTNLPAYRLPGYSPDFWLMNAQVSKTFGIVFPFEVYAGVENLTNYFQQQVIVAADQPFSNQFDASLVWGPVSGRMFYGGLRFTIK